MCRLKVGLGLLRWNEAALYGIGLLQRKEEETCFVQSYKVALLVNKAIYLFIYLCSYIFVYIFVYLFIY